MIRNQLYIFVIIFFITLHSNGQQYKTKPYKVYYPNGNLFIEGQLESRFKIIESDEEKDWLKSGEWTYYYEDGTIWLNGHYNRNELIGEWISNYPNGNPYLKGKYEQYFLSSEDMIMNNEYRYARSVGKWISYWDDGKIANTYTFTENGAINLQIENTKLVKRYPYPSGRYGVGETALSIAYHWNYAKQPFIDIVRSTYVKELDGDIKINMGNFYRYGNWKQYNPNGSLHSEGRYNWKTNGAIGKWIIYEGGKIVEERHYINDTITGPIKLYYPSGKLKAEGESVGIKKQLANFEGLWVNYYENGIKMKEVNYVNDKWEGARKDWNEDGQLTRELYKKGNDVSAKYYYKNKNINSTGNYIFREEENKLLKHGKWTYFYENGNKWKVEVFDKDVHKGYWEQYLTDGTQILKDGNGEYRMYEDGVIKLKSEHRNGSRDGITTWYYDNGQIEQSALYKYDEKSKPYGLRWEIISSYSKDGKPRNKGTLKNGEGTWISYDEKGNISAVTKYKDGVKIK